MKKQTYDFEAKKIYRQHLREFIAKHYPDSNRRNSLTVACFPGHEGLEITEVYLPLGIKPSKIYGIEQDAETYEEIMKLGLGINVHPGDAEEFLHTTDKRFDIVNLDFQSQFGVKEEETVRVLFRERKIKPEMILGTNFYGSRENEKRQNLYRDQTSFYSNGLALQFFKRITMRDTEAEKEYFNYLGTNIETIKDLDSLSELRDVMIPTKLRYLIGANIWEEDAERLKKIVPKGLLVKGHLIDGRGFAMLPEDILADPVRNKEALLLLDGYIKSQIAELFMSQFKKDDNRRDFLRMYIENSEMIRQTFITDFRKGRYVSDTGSPMYYDFLWLNDRSDLTSNIEVHQNLSEHQCKILIEDKKNKAHLANPVQIWREGDTLAVNLWRAKVGEFVHIDDATDTNGVFVKGDVQDFNKRLMLFSQASKKEMEYVLAERVPINVETLEEKIKRDIVFGTSDGEVREKYGLNGHELAGHKAALKRFQGWTPIERKDGNGNGNEHLDDKVVQPSLVSESEEQNNGKNEGSWFIYNPGIDFSAERYEEVNIPIKILSLNYDKRKLNKNEKNEIAEMLDDGSFSQLDIVRAYKISNEQIAGFLAAQTKRKKKLINNRLQNINYEDVCLDI